jgi:hypothetical protein
MRTQKFLLITMIAQFVVTGLVVSVTGLTRQDPWRYVAIGWVCYVMIVFPFIFAIHWARLERKLRAKRS